MMSAEILVMTSGVLGAVVILMAARPAAWRPAPWRPAPWRLGRPGPVRTLLPRSRPWS
jgi:hypothetical protein